MPQAAGLRPGTASEMTGEGVGVCAQERDRGETPRTPAPMPLGPSLSSRSALWGGGGGGGGGGVPWFNALFFHHEEATRVRKGARWPVSMDRPLGAGPGESSSPSSLASPSWGLAPKPESVRL